MRSSSIGYLFKEGARSVWVNRLMSVASIGVLTACMLLIGGSVLISLNINNVVGYVEDQNEVVAFVHDSMDDTDTKEIEADIKALDNVSSVRFISKEQALQDQKEKMGEAGMLLDGLEDDNPLPASFVIKVKDLEQLGETTAALNAMPGIEKVNAPTDIAETLVSVKHIVAVAGMGIVGMLVGVSLIIIANTIKITVFNRRKEISIMKYVGARDSFIRLPFVVEGLILGVVSALLAFLILWGTYGYIIRWITQAQSAWISSVAGGALPFGAIAWQLLAGFAVGGCAIGACGSMIFVRKHLKV